MSVVAVKRFKDHVIIGSDSITVCGYTSRSTKFHKLHKIDSSFVLGMVGVCENSFLFRRYCKDNRPIENSEFGICDFMSKFKKWQKDFCTYSDDQNDLNLEFILVFEGVPYVVEGFYAEEINDYWAIGAGQDYALGVLSSCDDDKCVHKAINSAIKHCVYCVGPITTIRLEIINEKNTGKK
jgi:ATP-dependent protease HslVU (ClpYQ) peptidase subunit